jgi:fibronectin-binding autotransporter adhesin
MSNFLRSFFGSKKSSSKIKPRMQSKRLELLGLEDRITPATISLSNNQVVIQLVDNEDITNLNTSVNGALITINTVGSNNNTPTGTTIPGLSISNNAVVVDTAVLTNFAGISVLGFDDTADFNSVTIGATGIDLSNAPGGADQSVSINLTQGTNDADVLNVNGAIKSKGTGGVTLNASAGTSSMTIAAAGDITTTGGAVSISSVNLTSSGDITTGSGNISFGSALNLGGDVAINSTSGNLSMGIVTAGGKNLTINQGTGTVAMTNSVNITTGNLSITTTNATANAIKLQNTVAAGDITLNAAGDITASNTATVSGASVNAKSTAGDVIFNDTVTTTGVGGFTSEATLATKATKIAKLVSVGAGANALVTGNLVSTADTINSTAEIRTIGTATITITGKVDGVAPDNDLVLTALNGAITIGGAIGGTASTPTLDVLTINSNTSLLASGTVNLNSFTVGQAANTFTSSIKFADAVTVSNSLLLDASSTGTVTFDKTITATGAATINLGSANGAITVTGNIIGKNTVIVGASGSGNISVAGITTDNAAGGIQLVTGTGNITTSGTITTSGATANIDIDTVTSGNITINGNVSTSGGGNIFLGADTSSAATGTGNLTLNGTVTTTGTAAGDIFLGISNGSGAINKAVTAGPTGDVVFINNVATDVFTIASGATISAGDDVFDAAVGAAGIINLGANITALNDNSTNPGIFLDNSINLTGAVSIKAAGSSGGMFLSSVNGAQNLTLEAIDQISLLSVGQTTALKTVTVTNSTGVTAVAFSAANVVLADTTGNIIFNGATVITSGLTTAAKAYSVSFTDTTVLAGAPVFLNTGGVSFTGTTTSLTNGATITGNATSTASLSGTIVSGGAFNIGAAGNTGLVTIDNGTQLILNSSSAISTIANPMDINVGGAGSLSLLGVGTLTLSGDSSTSSGSNDSISVTNGTLNVTGKFNGAANIVSGTISGPSGTIGNLSSTIGNVTPGGTLKTGNIGLGAATNYNIAVVSSTSANNLDVAGTISLGSAVLNLTSVASGLKAGNQITIVNNDGSDAISGTFASLPEGSTVSAKDSSGNTVNFTISYKGGTNTNDVTLTVASVIPSQTATPQPMVAGQPALNKFTAFGADAGGGPLVTITFPNGTYTSFFAYASTFTGGVRIALGDVDGDGSPDLITGAGPGGGPQVNVYNVNTQTGVITLQSSFFAFSAPNFTGGVYVAAGQTNGDAYDDVIVGAGATGGSRVQVYAGSASGVVSSSTLNDFFAYSPAFTGGVVVAAGDRNADGDDEVITAPASNGGWNIKSFDCNGTGNNPTVVDNFFAFNNTTAVGGLSLAVGYFNTGGVADLVIGTSNSGYGVIVDSATSGIAGVPFAGFTGAIRAGVAEDSNGQDYAVALAGPTGGPRVSVFSVGATSLTETDNLFVMNQAFRGGLFGTPTLPRNVI